MKNIRIVYKKDIESFIYNLWQTEEFRQYHKKDNSFIKALIEKLSNSPLFFYDISDTFLEKNHLTALFRFVAFREYENKYVQDLYYLHELSHIANFKYEITSFEQWREKVSENELFASLVSEVFIYFYIPSLRNKTFENMWAEKFFSQRDHQEVNTFDLVDYKSELFQEIITQRRLLREKESSINTNEQWIIKFNYIRNKWLQLWQPYYTILENMMLSFENNKDENSACIDLINELKKQSNENFTPFWQVPLSMKKK